MTREIFIERFDQFADAPGAVAKMRELVPEFSANDASHTSAPSGLDSFFHAIPRALPGRCPGLVWAAALRLDEPAHEAGNLL